MAHTYDAARGFRIQALIYNPDARAIFFQVVALVLVILVGWMLVTNTLQNMAAQDIRSGFGFLDNEAGFAISESLIPYDESSTYARAFVVGLLNTLSVAALGIVLATVLGVIIGIARLSTNWLVARLASAYVEIVRNIPLLLQLYIWYSVITESLPLPRDAINPGLDIYLTNRGVYMPVPADHWVWPFVLAALVVGIIAAVYIRRWAKRVQDATGEIRPALWYGLAAIVGLPLLVWLIGGAPTQMDTPALQGFNFRGGSVITPEFTALLLGLTIYTAGFIAEIVRGGILAVSHGQTEAARALGLKPVWVLRLVVLPQALRVIIPPTTSQYLNLTKNSSLAVAIGYPDLVSVGNTTLNITGQAIEAILIYMSVYLSISLAISAFMNWYNRAIALVER